MPSYEIRRTQESYDRLADRFWERTRASEFARPWIEKLAGRLDAGARLIDLGSGPGRHGAVFQALGMRVVCFDRSMGMHRSGTAEYPVMRVQGDLRALPFAAASHAAAFANAGLLHEEAVDVVALSNEQCV